MSKYNEFDIAFDFPFDTPLKRLIMVCIAITGSGGGDKEKVITDKKLHEFCCCSSAELITAINFLIEQGFIVKRNFGYQHGQPSSGYTLSVPPQLRDDI